MMLCLVAVALSACSSPGADPGAPTVTATPEPLAVDLDLSKLSGTVVYAQVYNLMNDYGSWLGKVITEKGPLKLRTKPDDDGRVLDEIPNGKNCHVSKADRHDTRLCRVSGASGLSVL